MPNGSKASSKLFWERSGVAETAAPPMFAPFRLRDMTLENRIVVSPMATYSATDGTPGDFHLVHSAPARRAAPGCSSPK